MPLALDKIVASDRLPSLPQVALQVIELARAPDPDFDEAIRAIRADPAISSKILRTVNSALFGIRRRIDTIEDAIPLLGMTAVRTIVLGFSLASQKPGGKNIQRPFQRLWRSAVTQATFAELLASEIPGADPPSYFLGGLLQDVGILACLHVLGEDYVTEVMEVSEFPNVVAAERRWLGFTHTEVSQQMCRKWGLPESLCDAIAMHHQRMLSAWKDDPLAVALRAANLCAQFTENTPREGMRDLDELAGFLNEHYRFDLEQTEEMLGETGLRVAETSALYAFDIGNGISAERLLDEAKRILEDIALHGLLAGRSNIDVTMGNAIKKQKELEEEAVRDSLTGVYNRRYMDRKLNERVASSIRKRKPVGFLFLDIDRFKSINDSHGHQSGDEALCLVADILARQVRRGDVVIRYGGDEFLVALQQVTVKDVTQIAERVCDEIRNSKLPRGVEARITSSIGALHYQPDSDDPLDANWLIDHVDKAMYDAKRNGGDRVQLLELVGRTVAVPGTFQPAG